MRTHLSVVLLAHSVTLAVPVLPVTVLLPPTQTGPIPNLRFTTILVASAHPPQSVCTVSVVGATVIWQPNGEVKVIVLVQLGDADSEQSVIVVVPVELGGSVGHIWRRSVGLLRLSGRVIEAMRTISQA